MVGDSSLPLAGMVVVDTSSFVSGPYCSMILGDLGATIIKVERPIKGDGTRKWGPGTPGPDNSYYLSVNRNKLGVAIDLTSVEGQDILHRLLPRADVFLHNLRQSAARRLALDSDTITRINPSIIYASVSGYRAGNEKPAFDFTIQAETGLMEMTGHEGSAPVKVPFPITDILTAYTVAIGILASLIDRASGDERPRSVQAAMTEVALASMPNIVSAWLVDNKSPRRLGSAHPNIAPYEVIATSDSWVALGAGTDKAWRALTRVLDVEPLQEDPRFATNPDRVQNREALLLLLRPKFECRTTADWVGDLEAADIPCAPVRTIPEAVALSGMVEEIEHAGQEGLMMLGSALHINGQRCPIRLAPPLLGEHTDLVLREFAGLDSDTIDRARASGAIQ